MKNRFDSLIFGIPIILAGFGLVMIYSASAIIGSEVFGNDMYFLIRQAVWLVMGISLMLIVMNINYEVYKELSYPLLILSFIVLGLVLMPGLGLKVAGAQRWINLGGLHLQPSEPVKLFMIIYFARVLSDDKFDINDFKGSILTNLLILFAVLALIILEKDLGSVVVILTLVVILFFYAGLKISYILLAGMSLVPVIAFLIIRVPYRMKRILAFINPWQDPKGIGFQIIQSLLSLGAGGIWGVGLGNGKSKLFYLPAPHTDFIFSVVGEELGFIGTATIIVLYFVLIMQGIKLVSRVTDNFAKFLTLGLTSFIAVQFLINIGVVTGLLPTKGITLPFISSGGSSLITNFIVIGILLNISRSTYE